MMAADTAPELTSDQLAEIERKFDPETAFRPTGRMIGFMIAVALVAMSVYHFYASGFGLVRELVHRGIHLSFVLGLVFLLFGLRKSDNNMPPQAWYRFDGVPLIDMIFAILAVMAAMYLPLLPAAALAQRVGNPSVIAPGGGAAVEMASVGYGEGGRAIRLRLRDAVHWHVSGPLHHGLGQTQISCAE